MELRNSIKHINSTPVNGKNFNDKIYTCSYTLETLIMELKKSMDAEAAVQEKLAHSKKSNYHLKLQLVD